LWGRDENRREGVEKSRSGESEIPPSFRKGKKTILEKDQIRSQGGKRTVGIPTGETNSLVGGREDLFIEGEVEHPVGKKKKGDSLGESLLSSKKKFPAFSQRRIGQGGDNKASLTWMGRKKSRFSSGR